ncbi:casein kinase I-like [Teleopsis dalmanni]|uniref:casein kinase I-like n=1 Tax=Teleopsis dalmanni TaxID=139649 RepID=UPI0018CD919F|nr:casein kinase I-like [Teleopsis dalmanni]
MNYLDYNKSNKSLLIDFVDGKKYKCLKKIKSGGFGEVFLAINNQTNKPVAIKIENGENRLLMLENEFNLYSKLSGGVGFPNILYFGKEKTYNVLVMDLLGPSLEELFNFCERKFSLKTILMIGVQLIDRIKFVHSKNYIHQDIKSDNILIGRDDKSTLIYLVDFGLCHQYRNPKTGKHIQCNLRDNFCGTWSFASINALRSRTQSRRDDLEAIGYLLIYFHRGNLPWDGLSGETDSQKFEKIAEIKISTNVEDLCSGLPDDFMMYMLYCRSLKFENEPDYDFLKKLFNRTFMSYDFKMDLLFDWTPDKKHLSTFEVNKCSSNHNALKGRNGKAIKDINDGGKKRKIDETKKTDDENKAKKKRKK